MNFPALLGLDFLDSESLITDTVTDRLVQSIFIEDENRLGCAFDDFSVTLTRFDRHVYVAYIGSSHTHLHKSSIKSLGGQDPKKYLQMQ